MSLKCPLAPLMKSKCQPTSNCILGRWAQDQHGQRTSRTKGAMTNGSLSTCAFYLSSYLGILLCWLSITSPSNSFKLSLCLLWYACQSQWKIVLHSEGKALLSEPTQAPRDAEKLQGRCRMAQFILKRKSSKGQRVTITRLSSVLRITRLRERF